LRDWTAFHASRQRPDLEKQIDFLRFLLDRGAYPQFRKAFDQILRKLDPRAPVPHHAFHLARLHRMENEYRIHTGAPEDSFEAVDTALDRFYLANKLENRASMLTREKRYPQRHRFSFAAEIDAMTGSAPLDDWPEVAIWAAVVRLESADATRTAYDHLQALLAQHAGLLPRGKLRQVRGYMFNFLLRHRRADRREDYREIWLLARTMLGEGTLLLNGRLSAPFLRATVQTACLAGEAPWAQQFLEEHEGHLVGEDRAQVLALHKLMVAYHLGEYERVLRGSAILRHGDPRFDLQLRALQVKAFYDLDRIEESLRAAEGMRRLLRRKKGLSKRFAEAYAEFAGFSARLAKSQHDDREAVKIILREVRESETVEKLWLLERLAEV
jgi:hypothetical protein